MHLLRCILQGFGLSLLVIAGFGAFIALLFWASERFGDKAFFPIVIGGFSFLALGVVFTLACLGILH